MRADCLDGDLVAKLFFYRYKPMTKKYRICMRSAI